MSIFKMFRVCILVAWLLLAPLGISKAAISLRVNGIDTNTADLNVGQDCNISIYSSNGAFYTARLGFQVADFFGKFEYIETLPAAGTGASVIPYNQPPYTLAYEVRAAGGPTQGVQFVFKYTAFWAGQVTLELRNTSGALLDHVVITNTEEEGTGACCNPAGGDCQITTHADCHFEWKGAGTDCSTCVIPTGACCNIQTGDCQITTQMNCPGNCEWKGAGTECNACSPSPWGACCNTTTGGCSMTTPGDCPYVFHGGANCGVCSAPTPSVQLRRFEINQGFQTVDGVSDQNCALIETKPFDVNVTLGATETKTVKVELVIYNSLTLQQIGTKTKSNITITPPQSTNAHLLFNSTETQNMKAATYRFSINVKEMNDALIFNWIGTYPFKASNKITILAVNYDDGTSSALLPRWNDEYIKFAEQVFPVPVKRSDINCLEVIRYKTNVTAPRNDFNLIHLEVRTALHNFNNDNNNRKRADFVCAVIPLDVMNLENGSSLGVTYPSSKVVYILPRSDNAEVESSLAHEMGHVYGLGDEYVSSNTPPGKFTLDQLFNFNVPGNPPPLDLGAGRFTIAPGRPNAGQHCDWIPSDLTTHPDPCEYAAGWWCTGRYIGSGGYDVLYKHELPSRTFSIMSGGSFNTPEEAIYKWMSGPEYKCLIAALVPSGSGLSMLMAPLAGSPSFSGQRMLVRGILDINGQTAQLMPLVPVPNLDLTPEYEEPNCRLVFRSGTDEILGAFNFDIMKSDNRISWLKGPFCVVVDLPSDTVCIQVTVDGNIAAQSCLTENSPTVTVLSPNGGEEVSGQMLITWSASDPDSNNLSYIVEYSYDNGNNWSILTIDTNQTELAVYSNFLPGGTGCLVKVIASDGWNSSEDTSDAPFIVPTKPPEVTILEPADGTVLFNPESVEVRCTAYDPETGDINDPNAIVWSSNIDGFLGNGTLLAFTLSKGEHYLTATATDPEAKTGSASVRVKVLPMLSDFNCDFYVDYLDLAEFAENWLAVCSVPGWCDGTDIDRNGVVDYYDFAQFAAQWFQVASP